jgi:hypothetical protein
MNKRVQKSPRGIGSSTTQKAQVVQEARLQFEVENILQAARQVIQLKMEME